MAREGIFYCWCIFALVFSFVCLLVAADFEENILTFGADAGVGETENYYAPSPIKANSFDPVDGQIIQVSGGERFSAVLTDQGSVFMWGSNKWGQLGRGFYSFSEGASGTLLLPAKVDLSRLDDQNVIFSQVSSGIRHSLFLDTEGRIYSVGNCLSGKEEPTNVEDAFLQRIDSVPESIKNGDEEIIQISTGACSSFILTDQGNVYSFGFKVLPGQLGRKGLESVPAIVDLPEQVQQISVGRFHTLYLAKSGRVYISGRNEWGQLGNSDPDFVQETPVLLDLPFNISQVEAGQFHSLLLTTDSKIYFAGLWKEFTVIDNLQGFSSQNISSFEEIDTQYLDGRVLKMSAGFLHSLFLTDQGTVYSIGGGCIASARGRAGCNQHLLPIPETLDQQITSIDAGSFHSVIVTNGSAIKNATVSGFPLCPRIDPCFEFASKYQAPIETTVPPEEGPETKEKDGKDDGGPNIGLILGILAAVLIFILIVGGFVGGYYVWKWRKSQKEKLISPTSGLKPITTLSVEEEVSLSQKAARNSIEMEEPLYESFEKTAQNNQEKESFYNNQEEEKENDPIYENNNPIYSNQNKDDDEVVYEAI